MLTDAKRKFCLDIEDAIAKTESLKGELEP
jgi:hypothetical protein